MRFGLRGPRGNIGATGAQGDKGDTGDTGAAGADGDFNYTDRGDFDGVDFAVGVLTTDAQYHDLDLSGIVGAAVRLVHIQMSVQADRAGAGINLRTKGNTLSYNVFGYLQQVADVRATLEGWVVTDSAGKIQYYATNDTWTYLSISVRGWVEPTA